MTSINHPHPMSVRRHELLQQVSDTILDELVKLGISQDAADLMANLVADVLADQWGGQLINFPTNFRWKLSQREAKIYALHKSGLSIGEIAKEFGMHERSVRKSLDRMRARILAASKANNKDLFED